MILIVVPVIIFLTVATVVVVVVYALVVVIVVAVTEVVKFVHNRSTETIPVTNSDVEIHAYLQKCWFDYTLLVYLKNTGVPELMKEFYGGK